MPHFAETVLQAAGIGGWELEIATGRLTWTAVTFEIYELEPPHAPPVADALTFYPPEARPVVEAAIDTGTPWDIESPLVTARGRHRWVRSWGMAVQENGRTVRLVGAFQDVTDRHELNARTERLTVVASQMTNIIITTDRSGCIDWVNGALTRLTGYTLAEALGRKPSDLLQGPRTDPVTIRQMARGIADGTGFDVEIVNYSKAGVPCWMSVTCSPLRKADGTVNGFIAVQADISARRAAEDAARAETAERERAELLLRDVLETLPIGVSVFDADNRFVLANRAYREMFPITASFLAVGRPLEALMRLGVEHGQYGDVPADEPGREAWIARHMDYFRSPTGIARTLDMAAGQVMQVRERRSDTGTLVSVRADMTDLHTAEANARRQAGDREQAEALLQDVLDALPNAITAYDSDDRLVMSNRRYAEMFPISARFAVPGRTHAEIIRLAAEGGQYTDAPAEPAARDAWLAELLGYFRDGTTHELRLPDGHVAEMRGSRSQSGNRVTVRTDITDLKLAEARASAATAERARADALLRDVVNTVPSAIVAYDRDERLVMTNPAFGERASLPPAFSEMGERLEDVMRFAAVHGYFVDAPAEPAEQEAWIAQLMVYLRDPAGAPRALHLSDGHTVQFSAQRSESGNLVIVGTDITDLLRAQALLRDVVNTVPSAIVAYDRGERLVLTNPADAERASLPPAFSAMGERLEDVMRLAVAHGYFFDAPAATADHETWIAELLAYLRDPAGAPRAMRLNSGRTVQVSARRSENGNLVIVRTDITDLVRAQALLRDVLDAIPNSVAAYDSDDRLILSNPAYLRMLPVSGQSAVPGRRYEDIVRHNVDLGDLPGRWRDAGGAGGLDRRAGGQPSRARRGSRTAHGGRTGHAGA